MSDYYGDDGITPMEAVAATVVIANIIWVIVGVIFSIAVAWYFLFFAGFNAFTAFWLILWLKKEAEHVA